MNYIGRPMTPIDFYMAKPAWVQIENYQLNLCYRCNYSPCRCAAMELLQKAALALREKNAQQQKQKKLSFPRHHEIDTTT